MRAPPHWRTLFVALVAAFSVVTVGAILFVYHGFFDIAADVPHWEATRWVMETARARSIKAHAAGIEAPPGLLDPAKIAMGVEHFADHCAVCHGAPGVPQGDIARGLYPRPPDLAHVSTHYSEGELFWIIKHGIKMTGMPAWADHSDDEIWATVAFLIKLKNIGEKEYGELVRANIMRGMKHQPGGGAAPPPPTPDHSNPPGMAPAAQPADQRSAPGAAAPHGH